ncbi:uncharacterized protein I303_104549 [Kwoniella dejecticola CBS 10117]|uniref:Prokaryotic-type class I peptide chain release factors domain-containing protein n=1 Tax=Kwoniella dejecticola CBS 10117 TaxID=1296121 RepID=A0A1A6A502_9TREE|nr:uncharacterized protein I303_04474 [Kwoniella dejecticola CBS 10117]OBR85142.1 hypothetical protein I303_04474 [Kwoniella dejecticola CBS 10117]
MQMILPTIKRISNPRRFFTIHTVSSPSSVGCSHWTYKPRSYSTRKPSSNDNLVLEDDLFGDIDEVKINARDGPRVLPKLGSNDEIDDDHYVDIAASRSETEDACSSTINKDQLLNRPKLPGSIKRLNRILSRQRQVEIPEHELEEKFVRGRGPGGQAINKTNSSVSLIHLPTGIRVQSQPTRSREENRKIARKILAERLEVLRTTGQLPGYIIPGTPIDPAAGEEEIPSVRGNKSKSKSANQKEEEKALSGKYTKQEIKNEKERRRKLNKAKKARRKYGKKGEGEGEAGVEEESVDGPDEERQMMMKNDIGERSHFDTTGLHSAK